MANTDCKKILNLIPLYIDNCLSEIDTDIVSRHIDSCDACRKEYEFLSSLMSTAATLEETDLSADFHKKLMEKANDLKNKKRAKRVILLKRSSAGVAAAAVVALCVASFGNINKTIEHPISDSTTSPVPEEVSVADTPVYTAEESKAQVKTPTKTKDTPKPPKSETPAISPDEEISKAQTFNPNISGIQKAPSGGGSSYAVAKSIEPVADAQTEAVAIAETALTFTVARISPTEETLEAVNEILSAYEKDEEGYIVPDIGAVLQKISELGIEANTEESEDYTQNYIVIE